MEATRVERLEIVPHLAGFALIAVLLPLPLNADSDDEEERLQNAAQVLTEILDTPDQGIPSDLLNNAESVLVFPGVKKAAFGIGGSYGKGAMVCRTGSDYSGLWGPPAMYRLASGSIGFQIGGSSTDYVILVVNPSGANSLLESKVKLGADATAAAGPKGRSGEAATDAALGAEMLTYGRAKGLFAGVSLKGGTLRQDNGANKDLYQQKISAREIVIGQKVAIPGVALWATLPTGEKIKGLVKRLREESPKNLSDSK